MAISTEKSSTSCGVRVTTWGTHPKAGNGMLHFLDTQLFGGNVGHIAITLTIPADEEGQRLINQYCKPFAIPYVAKTLVTKGYTQNKNAAGIIEEPSEIYKEDVYEIHFSWWPKGLLKNIQYDMVAEFKGVNFRWDPKWERYINPERRIYRGIAGETIMAFGPQSIVHSRNMDPEKLAQINLKLFIEKLKDENESIDVLLLKLSFKDFTFKVGFTEKYLLDKFLPLWETMVSDIKNITNEELDLLTSEVKRIQKERNELISEIKRINHIKQFIELFPDIIKNLKNDKEYFVSIDEWANVESTLVEFLGREYELWKNEVEDPNALSVKEIEKLGKICRKQIEFNEQKLEPKLKEALLKRKLSKSSHRDIHIIEKFKKELLEELRKLKGDRAKQIFLNQWKDKDEDISRILGRKYSIWKDSIQDPLSISQGEIRRLIKFCNDYIEAEQLELELNNDLRFPKNAFPAYDLEYDELYVSPGLPPDNTINLPINLPRSSLGNRVGLNVEPMLKQMQTLITQESGNFDLYTKNCSLTVGSILAAGAPSSLKQIFQRKAFGFFANPQEVLNSSIEFNKVISTGGKLSLFDRLRKFNPIERAGGYIIGVLFYEKPSNLIKQIFASIASLVIGPLALALFILRKAIHPLDSFNDALGLIQYTYSKPSSKFFSGANFLKAVTTLFVSPFVIILAPFAAIQYAANKVGGRFLALFKKRPSEQLKIEQEIEQAWREQRKEREQKLNVDKKRAVDANSLHEIQPQNKMVVHDFLTKSLKSNIKVIGQKKSGNLFDYHISFQSNKKVALFALRKYKQFLLNPKNKDRIPVFSKKADSAIQDYINKGYKLPADIAINEKGKEQTANELYSQLTTIALERSKEKQKALLAYQPGSPEFILNSILLMQFKSPSHSSHTIPFHAHKGSKALQLSTKKIFKEELAFLNNLKDELNKDAALMGAKNLETKALYLLTALRLVYYNHLSKHKLSPSENKMLSDQIELIEKNIKIKKFHAEPALGKYLEDVAKKNDNRKLVDKYNELMAAKKIRHKT